jgi:hypothetical protein
LERLSHGVLTDRSAALLDGDRPVDVLVGIPSFQNASDGASPDGTVEAAR